MKSRRTSWAVLIIVIAMIAACGYVTVFGYGSDHIGRAANIKLGLDLAGGVNITYETDDPNPSAEDMNDTIYKLQQRLEAWSTESEVYQEGTNRINVDVPGVYNAEELLEDLGNPGTLMFCEESDDLMVGDEVLAGYSLVLSGDQVVSASVATQNDAYGNTEYVVSLMFDDEGAAAFAEATERNLGGIIYIIYDDEVISAPTVNSVISDGQCIIEGNFTYETANTLATTIRAGALKLSLTEVSSKVVSAKLGTEALSTSLIAGAIGIGIVIIFMIAFYWIQGVAAAIALLLYVTSMLCFLNGLDITLTLPGLAGIILSIGMAVDANVIIFTRTREELAAGRNVRDAIRTGNNKALSAVIDGSVTTLIAAAILYFMGTGTIKGFAVTLALGIALSMFTALVVTRFVMLALYGIGFRDVKFYGKQRAVKSHDFVGMRKITYTVSAVVIVIGFVFMGVGAASGRGAMNWGLDFTGGTAMTVTFNEDLDVPGDDEEELRSIFEEYGGTTDIQFQNVSDTTEIVIKTPVLESSARADVRNALAEEYDLDLTTDIEEENISGVISSEMRSSAVISVIIAGICILIYIWIRFRDVRFGFSSIIALLHDVLIVLMVYAVLRISVGTTFIACMLTIVGYSINATIVVFDRIRENLKAMPNATPQEVANRSIGQTLSRSINTSLTTFIMVLMLFILGVTSIREFALPMMAGIIAGTWSSVFISGTLWSTMRSRTKKD